MLSCQSLAGFSSSQTIVSKVLNIGREFVFTREEEVPGRIKTENKTHITQVHPPPSPAAPGTPLIARSPGAVRAAPPLPPAPHHPAAQVDAPGAGKRLGRGLEVRVEVRVVREDLVEDAKEAGVLAERAGRRRELRRRADRQARVGRLRGQVGQQVRGRGRGRVGEDFLWVSWSAFFSFLFCTMLYRVGWVDSLQPRNKMT